MSLEESLKKSIEKMKRMKEEVEVKKLKLHPNLKLKRVSDGV